MKKIVLAITAVIVLIAISVGLVACKSPDYLKEIESYKFWANDLKTAAPQTVVSHMVAEHLSDTSSGKAKKVAVLGFDGLRADTLVSIMSSGVVDKSSYDDYSGKFFDAKYSGMNTIREDGGKVYLSYAGGEKGTDTQQFTSTAPGWAAITSGVWGKENGVTNNTDKASNKMMLKNMENKTFMLRAAEGVFGGKAYKSSFYAEWQDHFDYQYKAEIDYLAANPNIGMKYIKAGQDDKAAVAMKEAVTEGTPTECDVLFGILELPDYNGHETSFDRANAKYATAARATDNYYYDIINTIKTRSSYEAEDWLIILTTDHGGKGLSHGGQTPEERMTFIVSNKDIDAKYLSKNFNGFVDKK